MLVQVTEQGGWNGRGWGPPWEKGQPGVGRNMWQARMQGLWYYALAQAQIPQSAQGRHRCEKTSCKK